MRLYEHEWDFPWPSSPRDALGHFGGMVQERLAEGEIPVRFVVCSSDLAAGR